MVELYYVPFPWAHVCCVKQSHCWFLCRASQFVQDTVSGQQLQGETQTSCFTCKEPPRWCSRPCSPAAVFAPMLSAPA